MAAWIQFHPRRILPDVTLGLIRTTTMWSTIKFSKVDLPCNTSTWSSLNRWSHNYIFNNSQDNDLMKFSSKYQSAVSNIVLPSPGSSPNSSKRSSNSSVSESSKWTGTDCWWFWCVRLGALSCSSRVWRVAPPLAGRRWTGLLSVDTSPTL